MWTRKELKDKARTSFKTNYWKTVLVGLLTMALLGGASASVGSSGTGLVTSSSKEAATVTYDHEPTGEEFIDEFDGLDEFDDAESVDELPETISVRVGEEEVPEEAIMALGVTAFAVLFAVLLIVFALALVLKALIINPLHVGASRFFLLNLNRPAKVREVAYAYDHNYREAAKTMFWRDLYTLLWGLLFVIPGIVKSYEYRMIPYLLAEDPTMTKDQAFAESKRMMTGNKWRTFVLDLSFIGWDILSAMTAGILSIFYVAPYKYETKAALYENLRYGTTSDDGNALGESETARNSVADVPVPPFAEVDAPQPMWDDEAEDASDDSTGSVAGSVPEA